MYFLRDFCVQQLLLRYFLKLILKYKRCNERKIQKINKRICSKNYTVISIYYCVFIKRLPPSVKKVINNRV
jgi:hypothetical protein